MRSRVLVFALGLSLPVVGCSSGDSNVIRTDPNNFGDTGPGGNNGRGDASQRGDADPNRAAGWGDCDACKAPVAPCL